KRRLVPTPLHFQSIACRGACGKTRPVPHNRRPRQEAAEMGVARCGGARRRTAGSGQCQRARGARQAERCSQWPPGSSRRSRRVAARNGCERPQIGADYGNLLTTRAFDLPDRLIAKTDPTLIADDEQHFVAIAESLEQSIADLSDRLDAMRKAPGGIGQQAMDRDIEIHRLAARLRALRRFGLDLCLGRIVSAENPEPVYVGRLGLKDRAGRRLLLDWRSPAGDASFGATHANPMGLASRRRYRWTRGRISDYWDEVFTEDGREGHAALDDQSAFIASLGTHRSARMRDVLGTIQ